MCCEPLVYKPLFGSNENKKDFRINCFFFLWRFSLSSNSRSFGDPINLVLPLITLLHG